MPEVMASNIVEKKFSYSRNSSNFKWKKWKRHQSVFVFISGVLFSFVVFVFLSYATRKQASFLLPAESNIQITYDYPALRVYTNPSPPLEAKVDKQENENEALGSLRLALEMKLNGKFDKALKLYQHAIALAPNHPKILCQYGEFLEYIQKDLVQADRFYFRALTFNPKYDKALANRQRTAAAVQNIDEEKLQRLDEKRRALASIDSSNAALRRATKEAYIQHIYHSVGIEGNSMSLAETRSILETRMAVGGKSIDEHNEILGMDSAMKYINASLVNKNSYITLKDILEIHKRVLGHVDPVEGGSFRRTQVYVGSHIPPRPQDLMILMDSFEQWLNSEQAISLHPVKYAAIAHYKLVHIHPFNDGNGRTSRLLMNTILMKFGFPPVIIQKGQRLQYYNYLQLANEGDIRPFIRFIGDCTEKTLDLYLWATSELSYQIPMLAQESSSSSSSSSIILGLDDEEFKSDYSGSGDPIRI